MSNFKLYNPDGNEPVFTNLLGVVQDKLEGDIKELKDGGFDPTLRQDLTELNTQVDLVKLLQDHNEVASNLYVKLTGDRSLEVMVPFKGKRCAHYEFKKDVNDDFIKFGFGAVSTVDTVLSKALSKNYESDSGTWTKVANNQNWYTSQVGATFTFTFSGTGFDLRHFYDNRGGDWEIKVDGVVAKTISTHVDAIPANEKVVAIATRPFRGFSKGNHTVVGTFKGDTPGFPPATSPSRGWMRNSSNLTDPTAGSLESNTTATIYDDLLNPTKVFDVLQVTSNKEFALSHRPFGTGTYYWMPDHGTGTAFAISQKIYLDDTLVSSWTPDVQVRSNIKSVRIVQKMSVKHPDDPNNPTAEIYCVHTISAKGVSIKTKVKFLRKINIIGYGMMFPVYNSFSKQLVTSYGNRYEATKTDGSVTDLIEDDKAISYGYINTGGTLGEPDTMVAMTIQNIEKTFRYGKSDRRTPSVVWLQHRDTEMQKLYPHVFEGAICDVGDVYEAGGTYFIGELPMASDLLS